LFVGARSVEIRISSANDGSATSVLVSFTNDLPRQAFLLKWRTPFDELESLYSFVVKKDGNQEEYRGAIALCLGPEKHDYLEFNAFQTRSLTVDLADAFDFAEVGQYEVQLSVRMLEAYPKIQDETGIITSNVIAVLVTMPSVVKVEMSGAPDAITFVNCTNAHQNVLNPAWRDFGVAAGWMRSTVAVNPQGSALYRTWFGIFDNGRYTTVSNCINNLEADFRANSKQFYCNPRGCSPGVVAFVSSGSPNTIHVCQLYFQLSNRDHIFVIVHEELHFGPICGAPDYVYGRQGSMNLAISNPANAVRNSDNYRFYGEDIYYGK